MRFVRLAVLLFLATAAVPGWTRASDWGGIIPGTTTIEEVKQRYGPPSSEKKDKVENYDTTNLVYEGAKAPAGIGRMTVEVGLLTKDGYRPGLVRAVRIEPRPYIFPVQTIIDGWGMPSAAGDTGGRGTMFYEEGLIVTFDQTGLWAEQMSFTLPQPVPARSGAGTPPAPAAGQPKLVAPPGTPPPAAAQPPSPTRPTP